MERGEVWWAQLDEKRLVVLLSGGAGPEFLAVQIVEPATPAQQRGFVVMSGEQAVEVGERRRIVAEAGSDCRAVGIEVFLGAEEGLADSGVVRVALPEDGRIFCTWGTTVGEKALVERVGALSAAKQHELDVALALAAERVRRGPSAAEGHPPAGLATRTMSPLRTSSRIAVVITLTPGSGTIT